MANLDKQTPALLAAFPSEGRVYDLSLKALHKRFIIGEEPADRGDVSVGVLYYHSLDDLSGKQEVQMLQNHVFSEKAVVEFRREGGIVARFESLGGGPTSSKTTAGFWIDLPTGTFGESTTATIHMDVKGASVHKLVAPNLSIQYHFKEGSDVEEQAGILHYNDVNDLSGDQLATSYWSPRAHFPAFSRELSIYFVKDGKFTARFEMKDNSGLLKAIPYTQFTGRWSDLLPEHDTCGGRKNHTHAIIWVDSQGTTIYRISVPKINSEYFVQEEIEGNAPLGLPGFLHHDEASFWSEQAAHISYQNGQVLVKSTDFKFFQFESTNNQGLKHFPGLYANGFWKTLSPTIFRGLNHTETDIRMNPAGSWVYEILASEISAKFIVGEGASGQNLKTFPGVLYYDDDSDLVGGYTIIIRRSHDWFQPDPRYVKGDLRGYILRMDGKIIARFGVKNELLSSNGFFDLYYPDQGRWEKST